MKINRLICLSKFRIKNIEHDNNTIKIFASIRSSRSQCPDCGFFSSSVHDFYHRTISDLPVFQNKTIFILKTRKFKCKDPTCHRKVFSEQTPNVMRYARRTARASQILDSWSIELTGKLGSILSKQISIPVSPSTITRIALKQQLPEIKQPRVLGVDDWAYRKGVSYGTVLIDMETSRPIDLLSSRESSDLKKWLTKYPDTEIVTRDRSGAYSSAINEVCPDAIQIADRFHLLMNLSDALDKYFKSVSKEIRKVITERTDEILTMSANENRCNEKAVKDFRSLQVVAEPKEIKVDQRLETFKKVKELQSNGTSLKRISKILKISRNTVRSYFIQETLSPRIHQDRSTLIYLPVIFCPD